MNNGVMSIMSKKLLTGLAVATLLSISACGDGVTPILNPNFPSVGPAVQPSASVSLDGEGQVIDLAPSDPESIDGQASLSGATGSIADQDKDRTLCVLVDAEGGNVDLEVCPADQANQETGSASEVCPDEIGESYCISMNTSIQPDFCEVTGETDYVFALINRSPSEARAVYQVIDVTDRPNQSCDDLGITENSIAADAQ